MPREKRGGDEGDVDVGGGEGDGAEEEVGDVEKGKRVLVTADAVVVAVDFAVVGSQWRDTANWQFPGTRAVRGADGDPEEEEEGLCWPRRRRQGDEEEEESRFHRFLLLLLIRHRRKGKWMRKWRIQSREIDERRKWRKRRSQTDSEDCQF